MAREFARTSTVLAIAHRLQTIVRPGAGGADRILVMSDGRVGELNTPARLLDNPDSLFSRLVNEYSDDQVGGCSVVCLFVCFSLCP